MNQKIFKYREDIPSSITQKLFGIRIKENAIVELNNLLRKNRILSITIEDIISIGDRYHVKIHETFKRDRYNLYKGFLQYSICTQDFSNDNFLTLKHLRFLLSLSNKDLAQIHTEVNSFYNKENACCCGEPITNSLRNLESEFLNKLERSFHIKNDKLDEIFTQSPDDIVKSFIDNAVSNEKLNKEEEAELFEITGHLNYVPIVDNTTKENLEKYKLFWQIENGDFPNLDIDIKVKGKGICLFKSEITWFEREASKPNNNDDLVDMKVTIAKGHHWDMSNSHVFPLSTWVEINKGTIYLTDKRLILQSESKTQKLFPLEIINNFTLHQNGVLIERSKGKNVFLQLSQHPDILAMLMGNAILQL